MKAWWVQVEIALRLHYRNRMALFYGYLFPLIFLVAFWVLYRHESVPLLRHMGELLTVSVLGGACFGLPTTLVGERERGVWRRYRLSPLPLWAVLAAVVVARGVLLVSAGALQWGVAMLVGMTAPEHPWAVVVAFAAVCFAFIGLGLLIAQLANNVPAVQALGQCIFLPMLIIGGVAVKLASLPEWAQHVSAFFPGRYAVEAIQGAVTGEGFAEIGFPLLALLGMGTAGGLAAAGLFRWDTQQRVEWRRRVLWLVPVVVGWLAVGGWAERSGRALVPATGVISEAPTALPKAMPALPEPVWTKITAADTAALNYQVPPDRGVVAPFAGDSEEPDEYSAQELETVRRNLYTWRPAFEGDDIQRVRNLLYVAAVPDSVQLPVERHLPPMVLRYLSDMYPQDKLVKILTYIAMHPEEGGVIVNLGDLGLEAAVGDPWTVRERAYFYAIKFTARLTGRPAG
jgi:ABC-type transport system involved in cytochrome c biogenesis permease component